jgi:WD40-like Beta Propeller Repeat
MVLPAILAIPFFAIQTGQITETKLFKVLKGKVAPGSISISPDLEHYSYGTMDKKVIIDGKAFGPYNSHGAVLFSGDSKDYVFMANLRLGEASKVIWNGVEKLTDFPVSSLFRAGETGGICWGEVKTVVTRDEQDASKVKRQDFTRLMYPGGATDWMEKIEKIYFSDDGSLFAMRTSEKVVTKNLPPDSPADSDRKDFIVRQDGSKVARGGVIQVFPAPNGQGYATVANSTEASSDFGALTVIEVVFRGRTTKAKGEFYSKPIFSPDGKQFAFRNSFTGSTPDGRNIQFYQYNIGGFSIPDLPIQTGLTFAPDGKKWVMCGLNGKEPYLYVSSSGMSRYDEFPGLNGAPREPYKIAKFANGKLVLLFQSSRARPMLFVEDKGIVDLGPFSSIPDTMSISPDGTRMVIGGSDIKEARAFVVNLESPGSAAEILKPGYDLQNLGKATFVWKGNREVQFMILRNTELTRVTAKLD